MRKIQKLNTIISWPYKTLHLPLPLWVTWKTQKPWKRQSQQRPSGSKPVLTSCTRADKTTMMNLMRVSLIRAGAQTQSEKMIFFEFSWLQDVYTSTQVLAGSNSSLFFSFEIEKRDLTKTLLRYICTHTHTRVCAYTICVCVFVSQNWMSVKNDLTNNTNYIISVGKTVLL